MSPADLGKSFLRACGTLLRACGWLLRACGRGILASWTWIAARFRSFVSWWSWLKLVQWGPPTLLAIAAIPLVLQWIRAPIAIEPIMVDANATALGISGDALADQIKSRISEVNAEAGELFQTRKLGDATVPLDVKIGGWDLTVEKLTKAYHVRLTSAHVTGHLSMVEKCLVLETATSTGDDVRVSVFRMNAAAADGKKAADDLRCRDLVVSDTIRATRKFPPRARSATSRALRKVQNPALPEQPKSLIEEMDARVECLALRIVVAVSPDVAANYLFKRAEGGENKSPTRISAGPAA